MQDRWQPASAHNQPHQRGPAGQRGRGRSNRQHQSVPGVEQSREGSQERPTTSGRGVTQADSQPQQLFIPQRMIVLMGLPGSGITL